MTVSISKTELERGFSPFKLGPVPLPDGTMASCVENGFQFAKVHPQHLDANGNPSSEYWAWARAGWSNPHPVRYPMGKGAKPAYLYWKGEKLGYIEGRSKCYFPVYRDAVRQSKSWEWLQNEYKAGKSIALWDFDGYREDELGMTLGDVLYDPTRTMGHAFVLKAMLLYGPDVQPEQLPCSRTHATPTSPSNKGDQQTQLDL